MLQAYLVLGKRDKHGIPLVSANGTIDADVAARAIGARLFAHDELPAVRARLDRPNLSGTGRPEALTLPVCSVPPAIGRPLASPQTEEMAERLNAPVSKTVVRVSNSTEHALELVQRDRCREFLRSCSAGPVALCP
jgi:hypothetical protein